MQSIDEFLAKATLSVQQIEDFFVAYSGTIELESINVNRLVSSWEQEGGRTAGIEEIPTVNAEKIPFQHDPDQICGSTLHLVNDLLAVNKRNNASGMFRSKWQSNLKKIERNGIDDRSWSESELHIRRNYRRLHGILSETEQQSHRREQVASSCRFRGLFPLLFRSLLLNLLGRIARPKNVSVNAFLSVQYPLKVMMLRHRVLVWQRTLTTTLSESTNLSS